MKLYKENKIFFIQLLPKTFLLCTFLTLLLLTSCSSYMRQQSKFFSLFRSGQHKKANSLIEKKSNTQGKNQILYLLDAGLNLFESRKYKEAIKALSHAEKLTEINDFTSISEEVVAVLNTDSNKTFKPLDYERILINVYLALSYLQLEKYNDALVECRRINNLINVLKNQGLKTINELSIAWYISSLAYQIQEKYSDSKIDYNRFAKINSLPNTTNKELKKIKQLKNKGELVLLLANHWIPIKRISPHNKKFPMLFSRSPKQHGYFTVERVSSKYDSKINILKSTEIQNINMVATSNLKERISMLKAKAIAGTVAKAAIGYTVAKISKNKQLGAAAFIILDLFSSPDLRSWSTLPGSFQIVRTYLKSGKQKIKIKYYNARHQLKETFIKNIEIKNNKISFYYHRIL